MEEEEEKEEEEAPSSLPEGTAGGNKERRGLHTSKAPSRLMMKVNTYNEYRRPI
jgi:hypothetical protein